MGDKDNNTSFFGHLLILRTHLLRMLLYVAIGATVAFVCDEVVYDYIIFAPRSENFITYRFFCYLSSLVNQMGIEVDICWEPAQFVLQNREITGQFNSHVWVSIVAGIIVATPLIVWEVWRFISPALTEGERRSSRGVVAYVSGLFFMGVAFGYFIVVPLSLNFFAGYHVGGQMAVDNLIELSSYISSVVNISLSTGMMFQMPIAVYVLSRMGLVTSSFLKKYRRHAIVVILIISAILTPPDVASQVILAIPAYALYQVSIAIAQREERRREEEEKNTTL
ncbi:MAG: twin-arginine translocase subunit TatC [Flavobacteriales bacterium]|nr:twin-arginine translocase subunit TatC [Flavobacteriales bacterium]